MSKSRVNYGRPVRMTTPPEAIAPGIYLGDLGHARNLRCLKLLGITHIVNAAVDADCYHRHDKSLTYLHLPIADNDLFDISWYFKVTIFFIDRALSQNGVVLLHCVHGVSRGPSLAIAYLVARRNYSIFEALAFTKKQRPRIKPNRGFWHQLMCFSEPGQIDAVDNTTAMVSDLELRRSNSVLVISSDENRTKDESGEVAQSEGRTQFGSIYPDRIVSGLFLGDTFNAYDLEVLRELGITHILNAAAEVEPFQLPRSHITCLHLPILESSQTDISEFFDEAISFIWGAIRHGGQVLVHSNKGTSRSAALVMAYLIVKCEYSVFDSLSLTKKKRPRIQINPVFWRQLLRHAQRRITASSEADPRQ